MFLASTAREYVFSDRVILDHREHTARVRWKCELAQVNMAVDTGVPNDG